MVLLAEILANIAGDGLHVGSGSGSWPIVDDLVSGEESL